MTNKQIIAEAKLRVMPQEKYQIELWTSGAKWHRNNNPLRKQIEELRQEIEDISQRLDLIRDSELIQCYGSITGRLTEIIGDY